MIADSSVYFTRNIIQFLSQKQAYIITQFLKTAIYYPYQPLNFKDLADIYGIILVSLILDYSTVALVAVLSMKPFQDNPF
jgi:hypothetical protein